MADARSKATEKYRKANVKTFNVKFFPADADILKYFQAKSNRNQYIKNLIRRDMEAEESPKIYTLETVNKGDVEISVLHEHVDGSVDLSASISGTGDCREWCEVDSGSVEEVFEWLLDRGVKLDSNRALWLGVHYVADVMIDRVSSESTLIDEAAGKSADELAEWRDFYFAD